MEIELIELVKLLDHPLNANVMSVEQLLKLRRQIAGSGRYEPLVVRRHPQQEGCYELLNGHHRRRVLAQLGYERASCVVWEVSDEEALMLLATLNRLCGQDDPHLRGRLLEELGSTMDVEQLRKVLPETQEKLRKLLSLGSGPTVAAATPSTRSGCCTSPPPAAPRPATSTRPSTATRSPTSYAPTSRPPSCVACAGCRPTWSMAATA